MHGLDKLSERPRARRSCTAFVEPAAVLELAVGVVTEEVRRTDRPIRPRDCLGLVVKIAKREIMSLRETLSYSQMSLRDSSPHRSSKSRQSLRPPTSARGRPQPCGRSPL